MAKHNEIGAKGELLAAEILIQKGYAILHRNWRIGHKEIDIIAAKDDLALFVEVKTRSNTRMGFPEEAVGAKKIRLLQEAALSFMEQNQNFQRMQFDVITFLISHGKVREVQHLEDVFY